MCVCVNQAKIQVVQRVQTVQKGTNGCVNQANIQVVQKVQTVQGVLKCRNRFYERVQTLRKELQKALRGTNGVYAGAQTYKSYQRYKRVQRV